MIKIILCLLCLLSACSQNNSLEENKEINKQIEECQQLNIENERLKDEINIKTL